MWVGPVGEVLVVVGLVGGVLVVVGLVGRHPGHHSACGLGSAHVSLVFGACGASNRGMTMCVLVGLHCHGLVQAEVLVCQGAR